MAGEVVASQVVGKVKADISDLKSKYKEAKDETKSLKSSIVSTLKSVGSQGLGTLLGFAGFQGLSSIGGLFSYIFGSDEQLENTTTAFTKLLGSSKAAKQEIADLQQFAAATPLELPDVEQATQALLGYGFQLKQTKPLITAIGDALAATGHLDPATLQQVVTVFGQMHASLHLQTQDLKQLQSAGINAFQLLADTLKPTKTQLDDLVKKGLIPAGDAQKYLSGKTKLTQGDIQQLVTDGLIPSQQGIDDLTTAIEKNPIYKGGMSAQSQTTAGRLSTLKDNLTQAAQVMSKPIFDEISKLIGKLGDEVSKPEFKQFAKTVGQDIAGALQTTITVVKNIIDWFVQWHQPIIDVGTAITVFFLPAIIKSGVQALISSEQIAQNFVVSLIKSGKEAVVAAAKLWMDPGSFFQGLVKTGDAAKANAAKVDAAAASEEAAGTAAGEAAVETDALAVSEDGLGASAATTAPELDTLAASETAVGDAADGAAGAAVVGGAIGEGGGVLGLVGAIGALLPLVSGDLVVNWAVDQLHDLTDATDTASEGFFTLKQLMKDLAGAPPPAGFWKDIDNNLLSLGNYADQAAQDLHNLDEAWAATLNLGAGFENPTKYNPGGGSTNPGKTGANRHGKAHASGGVIGPDEMLSRINDVPGGAGELVGLTSGDIVFTHNQSVSLLQGMQQGRGNADVLAALERVEQRLAHMVGLLASGAAATYNVMDASQLRQIQTQNAQRNQALYGRG